MTRYLRITNCIYCTHRTLKRTEGSRHESFCNYDKDRPQKIDSRGQFGFSMPHWCPLPTLWELLRRVLGG